MFPPPPPKVFQNENILRSSRFKPDMQNKFGKITGGYLVRFNIHPSKLYLPKPLSYSFYGTSVLIFCVSFSHRINSLLYALHLVLECLIPLDDTFPHTPVLLTQQFFEALHSECLSARDPKNLRKSSAS